MRSLKHSPHTLLRRSSWTIIILAAVLIAVRLALPSFVERYVNRKLNEIPEYSGSIGAVSLHLWRGAYSIQEINLKKTTGKVAVPFFSCVRADLSIQWHALFEGKVVGELHLNHAQLNFVNGSTNTTSQTGVNGAWLQVVKDLFPLRLNYFELIDSEIHYRDFETDPRVDLALSDVHIVGANFSNTTRPEEALIATINAEGRVEKTTPLTVTSKIQPSAARPTFNLTASLEKLPVTHLNDFLRAYANVDAEAGEISIYTELAAKNGDFTGSVKPLVRDLKLLDREKKDTGPLHELWESLVAAVVEVFTNQQKNQLATVIPLSGSFGNPKTKNWQAFVSLLKNAFIEALKPGTADLKEAKGKSDK